jgi:hypothetical protein
MLIVSVIIVVMAIRLMIHVDIQYIYSPEMSMNLCRVWV